jgi:cytochrome c oxidase accessory protein FixG
MNASIHSLKPQPQGPDPKKAPEPPKVQLYADRVKPYPKAIAGKFRNLKWLAMIVLLAIYYGVPFLRWDRGEGSPDQAVLIDMVAKRFYFFFIELWPQEVYYITGVLILAAIGLFLATALAGRMWCGFACPQTVWTDLFRKVEHWLEGDRNTRMKRDKGPWGFDVWWRKSAKHVIWVAIAAATGGAWVLYFNDAPTVIPQIFTGEADFAVYLWIAILTGSTYLLGGLAQEQVCIYMCPWPRIQSAMLDEESLFVTYRDDRGEPRGNPKLKAKGLAGDCVDCGLCAQVCPQGIDIRNGPQLECIQCALCIDACDSVMDKLDRPRGLIGYETEANKERRACGQPEQLKLVRPRTAIYAAILFFVSAVMLYVFANRGDLELNVLRDRNPLYVQLSDGSVRNGYMVKILNKHGQPREFAVEVRGIEGARIDLGIGVTGSTLLAPADEVRAQHIFIALPEDRLKDQLPHGEADITIAVRDIASGKTATIDTTFRGPTD